MPRWLYLLLVLIYTLWPLDLLPDVLGPIGWLDDLIVSAISLYMALRRTRERVHGGTRTQPPPPTPQASGPRDPYEVLEIARDAAPEEIKRAYREAMARYHPDKVTHLGTEFQRLAEGKAKEIQQAYETLTGTRS